MFIPRKRSTSLVDRVLDNDKAIVYLKSSGTEIDNRLSYMEDNFKSISKSLYYHRASLAVLNGRIGEHEYKFAARVVDQTELAVFEMHHDIEMLKGLKKEISTILGSVEESRAIEKSSLNVEGYLRNIATGAKTKAGSNDGIHQNIKEISRKAKLLKHSIEAFIDLKAGK